MVRPPLRLMQAAFLAACLVAFTAAIWPVPIGPEGANSDKALHFFTFYVLELLALVTARRKRVLPAVLLVVLGVLIEFAQGLPVVGRDRSAWDVVADALGVAAALLPWTLATWWPAYRAGAKA